MLHTIRTEVHICSMCILCPVSFRSPFVFCISKSALLIGFIQFRLIIIANRNQQTKVCEHVFHQHISTLCPSIAFQLLLYKCRSSKCLCVCACACVCMYNVHGQAHDTAVLVVYPIRIIICRCRQCISLIDLFPH